MLKNPLREGMLRLDLANLLKRPPRRVKPKKRRPLLHSGNGCSLISGKLPGCEHPETRGKRLAHTKKLSGIKDFESYG